MPGSPEISYIVSLYHRPELLATCLWSLKAQSHKDFEVIVTDNSVERKMIARQKAIVASLKDKRFRYLTTAGKIKVSDCYRSGEYGMKKAKGKWLCFPCEDCYYPPEWGKMMLGAAVLKGLDLVVCDQVIAGPENLGTEKYGLVNLGSITFSGYKTSFLAKREIFKGWLNKGDVPGACAADRATLYHLAHTGKVRWDTVRDLYYFHN